jgi:hypothetical protein
MRRDGLSAAGFERTAFSLRLGRGEFYIPPIAVRLRWMGHPGVHVVRGRKNKGKGNDGGERF